MTKPVPREKRICLSCGMEFLFLNSPSKSERGKFCSKSCGASVTSLKHGHASEKIGSSRTYNSYHAMIQRCKNPKSAKYWQYGAVGVSVCDRWLESFENFLADMGERPNGKTIDRFPDKSGNYSPDNCRWATAKEQQHNLKNNRNIEYKGKTLCISEWSRETGLRHCVISYRLKKGWPIDKVFETPAKLGNRVVSQK